MLKQNIDPFLPRLNQLLASHWNSFNQPKRAFSELVPFLTQLNATSLLLEKELASKPSRVQFQKEISQRPTHTEISRLMIQHSQKMQEKQSEHQIYKLQETVQKLQKLQLQTQAKVQLLERSFSEQAHRFEQKTNRVARHNSQIQKLESLFQQQMNLQLKLQQRIQLRLDQIRKIISRCVPLQQTQTQILLSNQDLRLTVEKRLDALQELSRSQLDSLRRELERVTHEHSLRNNTNAHRQFSQFKRQIQESVQSLQLSFTSKAYVDRLNDATLGHLQALSHSLLAKLQLSNDALRTTLKQQSSLLQDVCLQHIVGRWTWKSGIQIDEMAVWQEQVTNTYPENYIFSKGPYIIVRNAGVYQVCTGYFAHQPPAIQLLVNGKVLLSRPYQFWQGQKGPQVSYCLRELVFLQGNSRVGVRVNSSNAEGFLNLSRL